MKHLSLVVALAASPLLAASPAAVPAPAQEGELQFPQASPPAFVRDQIGLTTVEIEYARPSVRGRKIFGALVPYGEVWRTGANGATKITFKDDVTFAGEKVQAGTYGLFTIPGKDQWTVILNKASQQWGSYAYDAKQDVARATVKATKLERPVETMTLGLGHFESGSAHLVLEWETTRVAVPIGTDLVARMVPRIEAAMAAEGGQKPYFQAAMFYYSHDLDLFKAREWMNEAEKQQPDAVWVVYRKGLILAKMGDKEGAMEAAKRAAELAKKAGGELGAEYGRLSESLVTRLQS